MTSESLYLTMSIAATTGHKIRQYETLCLCEPTKSCKTYWHSTFVLKIRSIVPSMSIIALRSTQQRSLAVLPLSSPLCPVSFLTNWHLYDSLASLVDIVYLFLSSSLSSTHILRTLPDIQPDDWLRLVQHASTVGRNSERFISWWSVQSEVLLILSSLSFRCSDGIDRHRQEWLDYNCPEEVRYISHSHNREMSSCFIPSWVIAVGVHSGKRHMWGLQPGSTWRIHGLLQQLFSRSNTFCSGARRPARH